MNYINIRKLVSKRHYKKWGYVVLKYVTDGLAGEDVVLETAFTWPDLYYIGDRKTAYFLCAKKGIKPQPINPIKKEEENTAQKAKDLLNGIEMKIPYQICSIGFCEKEQKWYGWSHRAIYGFGIGSRVRKGDVAYQPVDKYDLAEEMVKFWAKDDDSSKYEIEYDVPDPHGDFKGIGVLIKYGKKDMNSTFWEPYPEKWGPGEWEAKTLEDAKKMAIAFAEDVA